MATKESSTHTNVWFGVAMFLIGLIAGVVLTFASGSLPTGIVKAPGGTGGLQAPNAPQAPQAPQGTFEERLLAYAVDAGVDGDAFEACLADNAYEEKVNQQMADGQSAGVNGTPGNIVYDIASKKGIIISGAQPFGNFQKVIDAMLKDPASAMKEPGVTLANVVTPIDLGSDHVRGDTTAKIAVIEYSDYECPFCHSVHPTYEKLLAQYDGKIMWVFRHFPLSFHQGAMPFAIGAECVNELGGSDAFWSYTDAIMSE